MTRRVPIALALALLLAASVVAAQTPEPPAAGARAEVRIGLPPGIARDVSVEPDARVVVLDLPRGAELPLDFEEASGGLVRSGELRSAGEGRLRVELILAAGYLARVSFDSEALVLAFESRRGATPAGAENEGQYRLGPDDRITVTVHNHPELSATLTVSREGTVTVPLVGTLAATGESPSELERQIADLLGRSYLVDPQVDVAVAEYRNQWVMVTGEVPVAGRVALRGGTRLKEVLSEAGGFRELSGEEILISRRVGASDEVQKIVVDRREFEAGTANPILQHGDIIEVTKAQYCYVQGEVRSPGRVPIERKTTLLQVITIVGGLTEWADRRSVTILSGAEGQQALRVNLKRIQENKDPDPVLKGGEIVVVGRRFF